MNPLKLPDPITTYFAADRQGDAASIARCFTDQAVVRDEGRTHEGIAAIKAWKVESAAKYSYTSEPIGLEATDGGYVVTSRLTGNFPGSPVNLRYTFRLEGDRIAFLAVAP